MKFSTTFRLLVVVGVLALLVWMAETRRLPASSDKLVVVAPEEITALSIQRDDFSVDCIRRGAKWMMAAPIQTGIDEVRIRRLLEVIAEDLRKQEVITRAQREERTLSLADYGLKRPQARVIVEWERNGSPGREEIWVGTNALLGDTIYVKIQTNDDVVATSRAILDALPATLDVLRDRSLLPGEAARASRLELKRADAGFVQLLRKADGWTIQQPIATRADNGRVSKILEAAYALRVEEFVWDPGTAVTAAVARAVESGAALAVIPPAFRLTADEAVASVKVWQEGDEAGTELLLGKAAGGKNERIYARRADGESLVTVNRGLLEAIRVSVNDLRDKNLFAAKPEAIETVILRRGETRLAFERRPDSGWGIVEPVQWKADDKGVTELIEDVTLLKAVSFPDGTNLADFGLAPPFCSVQVLERAAEPAAAAATNTAAGAPPTVQPPAQKPDNNRNRLWIGQPREGKGTVFVKFEADPFLFEVTNTIVVALGKNPVDPLVYRNRTVLSLKPENIRRIALSKFGKEESIARDDSGEWNPVLPSTRLVNRKTVDDLLFHAANLRALRIECQNPEHPEAYIDRSVVLTFGLTGDQGIQKSLLLGFRSRTDGVFAMVQGQDVVFVLSTALVESLTRDLTSFEPSPSGGK